MVGLPKTLEDLRRVEAAVEVICNKSGHVDMLDREVGLHERAGAV